jgi:phage/plasmid-associated DNA primase
MIVLDWFSSYTPVSYTNKTAYPSRAPEFPQFLVGFMFLNL